MIRKLNTSPFAIYKFEVNNTGMIPIIFKYGEPIDISTTLQFAPTIGGVMSVVHSLMYNARVLDVDPSHSGFSIITKLNYVHFYEDNKYIQTLYAYETKLTEKDRHDGNIFEIKNDYHIDSSLLPRNPNKRDRGYFVLNVEWKEKTEHFEGIVSSFSLPISEETEGRQNG